MREDDASVTLRARAGELASWGRKCIVACSGTWLAPITSGMSDSGSVAWVASSMRTVENRNLDKRGSPAPEHVQQMTSAC